MNVKSNAAVGFLLSQGVFACGADANFSARASVGVSGESSTNDAGGAQSGHSGSSTGSQSGIASGSSTGSASGSSTGSASGSSAGSASGASGNSGVSALDAGHGTSGSSGMPDADAGSHVTPVDAGPVWDGHVVVGDCSNLSNSTQWEQISPVDPTKWTANAIAVRPDRPGTVFVGMQNNGIYRSDDCGATWNGPTNTGMGAADISSGAPWSLVVDPMSPDIMYTVEGYGSDGVFKSTNAGVDWVQVLTPDIVKNYFGQITSISLDPGDHTHIVVESHDGIDMCSTATCLAESTDSGTTWTLLSIPTEWAESSGITVLSRKIWLYTTLASGVWRTADEGVTWTNVSPPGAGGADANYYEPFIFQASDGSYYMPALTAPSNQGLMKSAPNDSSSWSLITFSNGMPPGGTVIMPTANNLVWSGQWDAKYWIAPKSDPTSWKSFVAPSSANVNGGVYMAYDSNHQVLYSANFQAGFWRIVTD